METKAQLYNSFPAAIEGYRQETDAGWEVDPRTVPNMFGFNFQIFYVKGTEAEVDALTDKPTRADILARAREAKKLKAAGQ